MRHNKLVVLFAPLALAGCGDMPKTKADIQSIAHDAALEATSDDFATLNTTVEELQTNFDAAKGEVEVLQDDQETLQQTVEDQKQAIEGLEQHDREVRERLAM